MIETQEMLDLVTQDSAKIIKKMQATGKSCSMNELIGSTHLVAKTFLQLEVLYLFLQLPYDIKDKRRRCMFIKLFLRWYEECVTYLGTQWCYFNGWTALYSYRMLKVSFDLDNVISPKKRWFKHGNCE